LSLEIPGFSAAGNGKLARYLRLRFFHFHLFSARAASISARVLALPASTPSRSRFFHRKKYGAHRERWRQNAATLCPLRACPETGARHFVQAFLLRCRYVIAPPCYAALPLVSTLRGGNALNLTTSREKFIGPPTLKAYRALREQVKPKTQVHKPNANLGHPHGRFNLR
jgi:hypothetical protein